MTTTCTRRFTAALMTCTALGLSMTCALATPGTARAADTPSATLERGPAEVAEDARVAFDIAAQPLGAAIDAFIAATGWQVGYTAEIARDRKSPGVTGSLTPTAALTRLLSGTGVTFRLTGTRTVALDGPQAGGDRLTLGTVSVEGRIVPTQAQIGNLPPEYAGGQVARGGSLGLLGNRDIFDAPVSVTSYTSQKIQDQEARTAVDVARTDPSFRASSSNTGMLDAFFIRGFDINMGNFGDVSFDGAYGVAPNYRAMTEYAERIEIIKGPTALINGLAPGSSVGGSINIVPKRAPDSDLTRLNAGYGDGSQFREHLDIARRYGDKGQLGARINASYSDGDTPLDNQARMAHVVSGAFDIRGEDFRVTLDVLDQSENFNAPYREIRVKSGVQFPDAPNGRRNVSQNWEWSDVRDRSALLKGEYDVNDGLTLFAGFGRSTTDVDRLFGYPVIQNDAGDTSDTVSRYVFEIDRLSAELGARGEIQTGMIEHRYSLQATGYQDQMDRGNINGSTAVVSNIYAPVAQAAQHLGTPENIRRISETEIYGVALADTLSAYDERVQLTLGMRWQRVKTDNFGTDGAVSSMYDDHALSPMAGLVMKPLGGLSLYANYVEGLTKGDIAPNTATNAGQALAPYVTKQYEIGAKWDFGKVATTLSAFQITKPFAETTGGIYGSNGEQRNRGVELSLFGEIIPSLRVLGGVTMMDAEITQSSDATKQGRVPMGVPDYQANLGVEWDTSFVDGLTLGAGVTHTGGQHVDSANTVVIPSWTTVNIGARYRLDVQGRPVTFRATINNLFDAEYWSGSNIYSMVSLGAPRTFMLSMTGDF
ncbi:MAG: TonB-dependent receptor [Rhodospirillales bacterium]